MPHTAIIGTGFGGIGMALALQRAGLRDFTLFERADEIGGVWRDNTYPGAGCDIPSPLYSFSFEPNARWPRRFSLRADIHAYLRRTATKYGIDEHIRFDTEITDARFDERSGKWRLSTAAGLVAEADFLVSAVGQMSRPSMPSIPGISSFAGPAFHSVDWDHGQSLAGKRVAVIGTGASAIQFVPRIQPMVADLTLFQRTAPYVLPKPDRAYRRWHHEAFERVPVLGKVGRLGIWAFCEATTLGLIGNRPIGKAVELLARGHLRRQVKDPVLRARLTPGYRAGCKRVLFANDYYPALTQPNVHLETGEITEITPRGVRTADGVQHEVDTIIYGTGFTASDFLAPMSVRGRDGRDLRTDAWSAGAHAYLGMAVPGFPNMFLMYGPNTNLGSGSIIYMLERQARYITEVIRGAGTAKSFVDVRAEVAARFDEEIQQRLTRSVWTTCHSWYRAADGRVSTNWPGLVSEYDRRTREVDFGDYHLTATEALAATESTD